MRQAALVTAHSSSLRRLCSAELLRLEATWGKSIQFALSGEALLRVFWTPGGLHVNLLSTTRKDDIPPMILELPGAERREPLGVVERRLRGLRTLHAIVHLALTERIELLRAYFDEERTDDIDTLLGHNEALYLEALSAGSWYHTVWTGVRGSYRSLIIAVEAVYPRAREAILRKLEAEARIKELEAEEKAFKLAKERTDYALKIADKLPGPTREKLRQAIEHSIGNLLAGVEAQSNEINAAADRLLGPGSK